MQAYRVWIVLVFALLLCGCGRKPSRQSAPPSESLQPAPAHGAGAATVPDAGLQYTAPSGWIAESPASSNRLSQYRLARAAGDPEDAEMVVVHFPGGGGTPQANVERWISQFTRPDGTPAADTARVVHKKIGDMPCTLVDVSGTYAGSMMAMQASSGAKPHFRMLAAIAESSHGLWFFKLTGPENTIKKWESSFDAFLSSIRQKS